MRPRRRHDQIVIRISPDIAERLELQLEREQQARPGAHVTRSDVVRGVLLRGLPRPEK